MGVSLLRSLPIIETVLRDKARRDRLSELETSLQMRVYTAIAVMLIHHGEFLTDDNRLLAELNLTLGELVLRDGERVSPYQLGSYSRNADLHVAKRCLPGDNLGGLWKVILTPPPELVAIVAAIPPWRPPVSHQ